MPMYYLFNYLLFLFICGIENDVVRLPAESTPCSKVLKDLMLRKCWLHLWPQRPLIFPNLQRLKTP